MFRLEWNSALLCPAPNRRGHKAMMLPDVSLSVTYIGPKSKTERPRKTKIGTEVAHFTRDSDITFKVKRSKVKVTRPLYSPPCWRVRQLQRWCGNVLAMGNYCYVSVCSAARSAHGGGEGRGHTVAAARLQVDDAIT